MTADVALWILGMILAGIGVHAGVQLNRDIKRDMERHKRESAQLRKDMGWDE